MLFLMTHFFFFLLRSFSFILFNKKRLTILHQYITYDALQKYISTHTPDERNKLKLEFSPSEC